MWINAYELLDKEIKKHINLEDSCYIVKFSIGDNVMFEPLVKCDFGYAWLYDWWEGEEGDIEFLGILSIEDIDHYDFEKLYCKYHK